MKLLFYIITAAREHCLFVCLVWCTADFSIDQAFFNNYWLQQFLQPSSSSASWLQYVSRTLFILDWPADF